MYEHIHTYLSRDVYPFHMPGHKRNAAFLPADLHRLDMTEFPGMDNLHAPTSAIQAAQDYASALYGADESFLLVNGSSAGVMAAICACCGDGDAIAIARNAHISAYHGLVFSGASPVFLMPGYTYDGLAGGVTPASIPGGRLKAVLLTSPTYEGFTSDIAALAQAAHQQGAIVIVDEAHGAHFPFHALFPQTALSQGADIVVNSLHKTLPALSQCALLHVRGPRVDRMRLRYFLRAAQTTSPSYVMMASADYMLRMLGEQPGHFDAYASRLAAVRHALPAASGQNTPPLALVGSERIGTAGINDMDQGKLLFSVDATATGAHITETLASEYALQMEMATERHILAMTSVADTDEGFERLIHAVGCLNRQLSTRKREPMIRSVPPWPMPVTVLPPREAVNRPTSTVSWGCALGEVSGMFVTPYPPGVPLLAPGERITRDIAEAAAAWGVTVDNIKILSRG